MMFGKKKIVVIDDDEDMGKMTAGLLGDVTGAEALHTTSCADAVAHKADHYVVDGDLGAEGTGPDCAARLRKAQPSAQIHGYTTDPARYRAGFAKSGAETHDKSKPKGLLKALFGG